MRRLRTIAVCLVGGLVLGPTGTAQAIPSPEQLLTTVGLIPWLWGVWLGGVAWTLGWLLRQRPSQQRVRAVGTASLGAILLLGVAMVLGIVLAGENGPDGALVQEYRCDIGYHEARARAGADHGRFVERVSPATGGPRPNALILDLRTPWAFQSGHFPGAENIYTAELLPRLAQAREDNVSHVVLASYRPNIMMFLPESERAKVLELLEHFERVEHAVIHRGVDPVPLGLLAETADGPQPARASHTLDWPAFEDRFLVDEAAVAFPNAVEVLGLDAGLAALRDPSVAVVLAYHRFYRAPDVYREMWSEYLEGVDPSRLLVVDYGAPDARARIQHALEGLGSRPFVALGYGKFDTVHYGADFAFQASRRGNQNFLGASARLPELAAYRAASDRGATGWVSRRLTGAVQLLGDTTGLPPLGALTLFGVLLGFALLPLTWPGASARRGRHVLRKALRERPQLPRALQRPQYFEPIARRVGAAQGWIAVEAVALWTLFLLVVPALRVAAFGPATAPALAWVILCAVGATWLGASPPRTRWGGGAARVGTVIPAKAGIQAGGIVLLFLIVAPWLGAANVALLSGLLPVRILQEIVASFTAQRVLNAALLGGATGQTPTVRATEAHGAKATALARLSGIDSPLFCVAPGLAMSVEEGLADNQADLPAAPWVIRSSARLEDGGGSSKAGHYLSIVNVSDAAELESAFESVAQSVGDDGAVLIQTYLVSEHRGVLFSQAPKNRQQMVVEWRGGTAVDASPEPISIEQGAAPEGVVIVGRTTGKTTTRGKELPRGLLARLVWLGATLEARWGEPLDIEWGWAEGTLHVFQVRPVTAFIQPPAIARAQASALAEVEGDGDGVLWQRGELTALLPRPTPLTASVVEEMFGPRALARAWDVLGVSDATSRTVENILGRLYERSVPTPGHQPWKALRRLNPQGAARRITDAFSRQRERSPEEPTLGASVEERARFVVRSIDWLCGDLFGMIQAGMWLHDFAPEVESPVPGEAPSVSFALQRDLHRVRVGELDEPSFLRRWGHRSTLDYELSLPSFAEAPEVLRSSAHPHWPVGERHEATVGSWVRTIDWMKDVYVRQLRRLRPHVVALGRELSLGAEVFGLTVEDLRCLGNGETAEHVAARARQRWEDQDEVLSVELPSQLTALDVESLGLEVETNRHYVRFVSEGRAFSGTLRLVEEHEDWGEGDVLWSETLGPEVTPALPHVAGCLARYGGELSHAAIVARELGRPTAVLDADLRAHRGQTVHVDASGQIWFE